MTLALVITGTAIVLLIGFGGLLAIASFGSGVGKLVRHEKVVETLTRVGVPAARIVAATAACLEAARRQVAMQDGVRLSAATLISLAAVAAAELEDREARNAGT